MCFKYTTNKTVIYNNVLVSRNNYYKIIDKELYMMYNEVTKLYVVVKKYETLSKHYIL